MLPASLSGLELLANNLWWSWDAEASALWASVDPHRWDSSRQNPVALLRDVEAARWAELSVEPLFLARLASVLARFHAYLSEPGWCRSGAPDVYSGKVAYFSMEFGLHASLRIYSGGLGVLAGDHLKSASDLGIPLVGVGLLYRSGYFRQVIDDGVQVPSYPHADYSRLPIKKVTRPDGSPLIVAAPIAHHEVQLQVWRVDVGRTRLYLLDSELDSNNDQDRTLTHQLYGGDSETRIRQEVVLGIGGLRALRALGEHPAVYHMNEGHCAFVVLELLKEKLDKGQEFRDAWAAVQRECAFTTHTPVPAGHDRFGAELFEKTLGVYRKSQSLEAHTLLDLGRVRPGDIHEPLCMTVLALRGSNRANGVSKLHGAVSRDMWRALWPRETVDNVPIGHITNGVHPFFWMAPTARSTFDRWVPGWRESTWDEAIWAKALDMPDDAVWDLRNRLRANMVETLRLRTGRSLDPNALTIGFARRFAPYKRGDLLFRDLDRLVKFLDDAPGQVVFSGKAHPQDVEGKKLVAAVIKWSNHARLRDRVLFVEDYDMFVGHALTSGCDVWLNNPRRPQEASGTSGQKVVLNGGLNLSVLDGWWEEGYDGTNGWAIGEGNNAPDLGSQDHFDSESLYHQLESSVLPEWRERDVNGMPTRWLHRVRRSIATGAPQWNTHRMVRDYALKIYAPLIQEQR